METTSYFFSADILGEVGNMALEALLSGTKAKRKKAHRQVGTLLRIGGILPGGFLLSSVSVGADNNGRALLIVTGKDEAEVNIPAC